MLSKRMQRFFICGTLLICTTAAVLILTTSFVALPLLKNFLNLKDNREKKSGLQTLEPSKFDNQLDVECVNATVGALHFPMCIYDPQNDTYISRMVAAGDYFEHDLVMKWIGFFRKHPDVSFVDLGANLGTYSLPIAHSGIHVVAVEPNKDTVRRLAKSVHLGQIANNVDILHYAISNEESTTFLKFSDNNRGDTFMVGNAHACHGCLSASVTVLNKLTPFIRHKKALIKIDVQSAEIEIFQNVSAASFFDEIDVMMIQMEWDQYPAKYGQTKNRRRRVDRFLEFFYERGYDVYDPRTENKLDADWKKWTPDVLFKKEDLPNNQLFFK